MANKQPNILFVTTDQQRADCVGALGNPDLYTPNMDRLVARGAAFTNAYSTCPVCVPARYTIRTGCEPPTTALYQNQRQSPVDGQADRMTDRCGPYLAQRMQSLGYRTFGIGKFHSQPWNEDLGYDVHLHSEELFGSPQQREGDAFASFIRNEHPAYEFVEGLMGERTEMYYMPQMSTMPAEATVEGWAAARAVEQIERKDDDKPYFGFVSFVGPHPPLAPPIPFNRLYDPDRMPNPIRGDVSVDLMDDHLRWMNHAIWADDINDSHARVVRARYYGELTYIDDCLGKILDAVEARDDAKNTVIVFCSDHGEHLGDHHAWQKESFFDAAANVPFMVSWPEQIAADERRDELVCLTDLFGIATTAAGKPELREGVDVFGGLGGTARPRSELIGYYGTPGTSRFKFMVRDAEWKFIYLANGGYEQLFNLREDPHELKQRADSDPNIAERLRGVGVKALNRISANRALEGGQLKAFPYQSRPLQRIYQFDRSRGVTGFPDHPSDVLGSD